MAIYDNFEVTVIIGGQEAKEYEVPEKDQTVSKDARTTAPKNVRKFIEAFGGQNFSVKISLHRGYVFSKPHHALNYEIHLDGRYMCGRIFGKENYLKHGKLFWIVDGVVSQTSQGWMSEKFRFNDVVTTDEYKPEELSKLREKYMPLGSIEVKIWAYKGSHKGAPSSAPELNPKTAFNEIVPEKALKLRAITMTTALDSPEPSSSLTLWDGHNIGSSPLATFTFAYRTMDSLEHLEIVKPLEARDIDTMNEKEVRELAKRLKAAHAELPRMVEIKKEGVKKEPSPYEKRAREISPATADELEEINPPKRTRPMDVIDIDSD